MKNSNKNTGKGKKETANNTKAETFKFKSDTELAKLSDKELDSYLDSMNEEQLTEFMVKSNSVSSFEKKKSSSGSEGIYKKSAIKESETKKRFRQRIRKQRNSLIADINHEFKQLNNPDLKEYKDVSAKGLKNAIDSFNKFYKETYILNDYSIESIARKNSDKDTLMNIKAAFRVIRLNK